ncbi:hypothetical protein A3Q29_11225 [Providencia stuartii]|uniref:Uncharacterized protein n=1 Tax=Providencia stuartii TaxID=588 RepID=A0A1S1HJA1_PROST|nr:hypothetical protein A3Q29_11225 [Providencia stuartii]
MLVPDWVIIIVFVAILFVIAFVLIFFLYSFIKGIEQKSLGKTIRNKLAVDEVTFNDFKNLQKVNYINDDNALQALERLKASVDFDINPESKEIKIKLDALISEFIKKEPFSEFPPEIREMLCLIKDNPSDPASIDSLAEKLSIYIRRQTRSELWMKIMTVLGTATGIAGLVFAFYK